MSTPTIIGTLSCKTRGSFIPDRKIVGSSHVQKPSTMLWRIPAEQFKWSSLGIVSPTVIVLGMTVSIGLRSLRNESDLLVAFTHEHPRCKVDICAVSASGEMLFPWTLEVSASPEKEEVLAKWTVDPDVLRDRTTELVLKCTLSLDPIPEDRCFSDSMRVVQDLKEIYVNQVNCDFIIKIQDGTEIPVHRAMLSRVHLFPIHKTTMELKHFDLDTVKEFLMYMYTGNVECLSSSNVADVYRIATEFSVEGLKRKCIDIFQSNAENVMRSEEWCEFLKEHARCGNRLLLDALVKNKEYLMCQL